MEQAINERYREKAALRQASYARNRAAATQEKGFIIVHKDLGKGQTSAALGLALRALGQRMTEGIGLGWNTRHREQGIATARRAWQPAVTLRRDLSCDRLSLDERHSGLRYDSLPLDEVLDELCQGGSQRYGRPGARDAAHQAPIQGRYQSPMRGGVLV